jgi:hypothetical protein
MTQTTTDIGDLTSRLRLTAQMTAHWRAEAERIRLMRGTAIETDAAPAEILQGIEEITGQIYAEIARFDTLTVEVEQVSPASAAELGAVGDALRLVLLEITELGTDMYGVSSHAAAAQVPPVKDNA